MSPGKIAPLHIAAAIRSLCLRKVPNLLCLLLIFFLTGCCTQDPKPLPATQPIAHHETFVLVHGAFGGGWGFKDVAQRLTADGNIVYRPTLTGQGERSHLAGPAVNLDTHIDDIVNLIRFEDLHNVVLVGHSYGGMVVTGVVDRIPDRIKHVIYLDAALPADGESMDAANQLRPHRPEKVKIVGDLIMPSWISPTAKLPHDEPQPVNTFSQPIKLTNQAAAAKVPSSYVLYVPPGKKKEAASFYAFYQRAQARGWPVYTLTSTHNAQWTHPAELVQLLETIR